ncbi:MAG: hypothetical protein WB764_06240 [Xanthobacteraceae bacterium]
MAFALHFRSHPWHPISTAPCNRVVELRVRDGRAISTLEFPCRQTNAGDWINCDFGTTINIRPVEWRAWHGHSPQPQSLPVNTRGRLALTRRGQRIARQSPLKEMKPLDRSVRRPKVLTTMAYALVGIVVVATAVGSLTRISAWALPIGLTQPAPASSVAASSAAAAAASPSPTEDFCKEFGAAFLNSACATPHKKFAARRTHRVATFVIGRSDTQQ